jgi:hypothetical protein
MDVILGNEIEDGIEFRLTLHRIKNIWMITTKSLLESIGVYKTTEHIEQATLAIRKLYPVSHPNNYIEVKDVIQYLDYGIPEKDNEVLLLMMLLNTELNWVNDRTQNKNSKSLTAAEIEKHIKYDPAKGTFTRIHPTSRNRKVTFSNTNGIIATTVLGVVIQVWRLVYIITEGTHPEKLTSIKFKDGNNLNYIYSNLLFVSGNNHRKMNKNNTTKTTGVSYKQKENRYVARIYVNDESKYLGSYINKADAVTARKQAELKYYEET